MPQQIAAFKNNFPLREIRLKTKQSNNGGDHFITGTYSINLKIFVYSKNSHCAYKLFMD